MATSPSKAGKAPLHFKTRRSHRCLVTVFAMPFECLPSNCRASKLPSHRSSKGTIPRRKNSHTRHPGAQNLCHESVTRPSSCVARRLPGVVSRSDDAWWSSFRIRINLKFSRRRVGTFQGMFAFQQRQASLRCWRMVRDLLALTPCDRCLSYGRHRRGLATRVDPSRAHEDGAAAA